MINVTRRRFLFLAASAAAVGLVVPAFTPPREPYVKVNTYVDYIGFNLHPLPGFIGSARVLEIHAWDGIGYPVTLEDGGYWPLPRPPMPHQFYDSDLSIMRDEYPANIWYDPKNFDRYPNVHAYIREKRYGENPLKYWASRRDTLRSLEVGRAA
jgi:hypothetical protein